MTVFDKALSIIPNPNIETRIRVQVIGAYSEDKKYRVTLLVMWYFLDLLDVSRDCVINVFSISGLGILESKMIFHHIINQPIWLLIMA